MFEEKAIKELCSPASVNNDLILPIGRTAAIDPAFDRFDSGGHACS